jgi:hypothetical protein
VLNLSSWTNHPSRNGSGQPEGRKRGHPLKGTCQEKKIVHQQEIAFFSWGMAKGGTLMKIVTFEELEEKDHHP